MQPTERRMGKTNEDLLQDLKAREEKGATPMSTTQTESPTAGRMVAERLARKFGYGTDENRRRQLYERLEREVNVHGDIVYVIISDVVQAAQSARTPARWFCKSVILRLRERGYLVQGDNADW